MEAVGRHRQRWEVIRGGGEAQAVVESDGRRWGGTGSGRKRWEAVKWHRQR